MNQLGELKLDFDVIPTILALPLGLSRTMPMMLLVPSHLSLLKNVKLTTQVLLGYKIGLTIRFF